MAQDAKVHVVSKTNSKEHLTLPANTVHLPPLAHGDIRLQTRLISLTANNLSYARLGHIANWWDAFPVPQFLPAPYNDIEKYGIVPTWGYAEIIESRIDGLTEGTIVYGFWPSSTLPVDLQLVPAKPEGHYIDMTSRRHRLWSYYHRYTIPRQPVDLTSQTLAAQTVFKPLFECAHTLNTYVLGLMAVHPCPRTLSDEEWSHADLSATAVISLSASGKTARAFNDALLNNRKPDTGPLGLLAITTDPSSLMLTQRNHTSSTQTKTLCYPSSLTSETITFLNTLAAQKILLVDFGGRADSLPSLYQHLQTHLPSIPIGIVGVGASPSTSLAEAQKLFARVPERRQMNTSEVREVVVQAIGEEEYFDGVKRAWEGFCERGGCGAEVSVGRGVEGFEEGWERFCRGEGLVGGLAYLF